jgi:hypothetical protein
MEFNLATVQELLSKNKVQVEEGVFLCSDSATIRAVITLNDDNEIVIDFDAPFTYLHVEKLGPKKLLNLVKPRVEVITISDKSIKVKLSSLGEWEFER